MEKNTVTLLVNLIFDIKAIMSDNNKIKNEIIIPTRSGAKN